MCIFARAVDRTLKFVARIVSATSSRRQPEAAVSSIEMHSSARKAFRISDEGMTMKSLQSVAEADWDSATSLVAGATSLELTAAGCGLKYWLAAVPNGTLRGHVLGHAPSVQAPKFMREAGPLREALSKEFAFRSLAEEKATRAIAHLVALAPSTDVMEFYATQLMDEARHAMVFRSHLIELGVADEDNLLEVVESLAGDDRDDILNPLEEFGLALAAADAPDFIGGVVTLTVLVEGVLAPSAELSERKWRPLNPAAADIERGAGIDEIRHLSVGSWIARDHLRRHPDDGPRLVDLITTGMKLWDEVPVKELVYARELLFQEGLQAHADIVGDYEIWPGRRLIDTTAEERLLTALDWSQTMQQTRLEYMGLQAVLA
jgi:hypothetical protein